MDNETNKETESTTIKILKKSPMFQLSLGSKELFHSNFLAWISTISVEGKPNLGKEMFKLILKDLGVDTEKWQEDFEVLREKKNFDLAVCRKGDENGKNGYLFVLENKLKSVPSFEQVKEYNEKIKNSENAPSKDMDGITDATQKVLLTLMSDFPDKKEIEEDAKWKIVSYGQLMDAVKAQINTVKQHIDDAERSQYIADIFEDYCTFIGSLETLAKHIVEMPQYILPNEEKKELGDLRIYDLVDKLRIARFASEIKTMINRNFPDDKFKVQTGYGKSGAFVEIAMRLFPNQQRQFKIAIQGDHYSHGIHDCDDVVWHRYKVRFPNFFKKTIPEFQEEYTSRYEGIFKKNSSKMKTCSFQAKNGGVRYEYQYVVISKDATFEELMKVVEADLEILNKDADL